MEDRYGRVRLVQRSRTSFRALVGQEDVDQGDLYAAVSYLLGAQATEATSATHLQVWFHVREVRGGWCNAWWYSTDGTSVILI